MTKVEVRCPTSPVHLDVEVEVQALSPRFTSKSEVEVEVLSVPASDDERPNQNHDHVMPPLDVGSRCRMTSPKPADASNFLVLDSEKIKLFKCQREIVRYSSAPAIFQSCNSKDGAPRSLATRHVVAG